jgi:protein TonB
MKIGRSRLLDDRTREWAGSYNSLDPVVMDISDREAADTRRALRVALVIGGLLHVVIFLVVFPTWDPEPMGIGPSQPRLYVMKQLRFSPPEAQPRRARPVERPKARRIPIPDPTPEDPEPIFDEAVDGPEAEFPEVSIGDVVAIPDAPPGPSVSVYQIAGNVRAPEKLFAPDPVYPEEARLARVQGVVILQTVIDDTGRVTDIRTLKGLPSGLTEAAIEAVSQWRFKPATLEGKPVHVHYMITVSFSVQ